MLKPSHPTFPVNHATNPSHHTFAAVKAGYSTYFQEDEISSRRKCPE
jgi:hypothetical protein